MIETAVFRSGAWDVTWTAPGESPTIINVPFAVFSVSPQGATGQVNLDATASHETGATIVSYEWDFGDGAKPVTLTTPTTSHTYSRSGVYQIYLTVIDSNGEGGQISHSVTVQIGSQPIANFTYSNSQGTTTIGVDASSSTDPVAGISTYAWDFGDGATAQGITQTHTYGASGSYTVTLVITDANGTTASDSQDVVIDGAGPVASFTATTTNYTVQVNGSASQGNHPITDYSWNFGLVNVTVSATTNGLILTYSATAVPASSATVSSYAWTFGDGGTSTTASGTHTYSAAGTFAVSVVVTDSLGAKGTASTSVSTTAINHAPTVTMKLTMSGANATAVLTGYDADNDAMTYSIAWGDGATSTGANATHTYSTAGSFTVTATVTDTHGATGTTTGTATPVLPGAFTLGTTQPIASNTGAGVIRTLPTTANTTTQPGATLNSSGLTYTAIHFTGDVTIASPNITLNDCIVDGKITCQSSNAKISNCIVTGGSGKTGNQWLIKASAGTGTYIEFTTLHPTSPYDGWNGIGERNYTAYRCEIYNTTDGFSSYPASSGQATNVIEQGCYVHDLLQFAPDTQNGNRAQTHNDCHQTQGGSGTQIVGNSHVANNGSGFGSTSYNPQINMSCIMMNANVGHTTGLVVTDNWFDYGIVAVNGTALGSGDSVTVERNRFGSHQNRSIGLAKASAYTMPTSGANINYNESNGALADYYLQ